MTTDLSELEALVGRGVEYLNRLGEGGWGEGDLREASAAAKAIPHLISAIRKLEARLEIPDAPFAAYGGIEWGNETIKSFDAQIDRLKATIRSQEAALVEAREAAEMFARSLEAGSFDSVARHLTDRMCCNGHECGCMGSSVGDYLAYELRTAFALSKLEGGE